MFGNRKEQIENLNLNYQSFVRAVKDLAPEGFLKSLGDWTPRDIVAHMIGWNRITLAGCAELREGVEPFYLFDRNNDYRKVNVKFLE